MARFQVKFEILPTGQIRTKQTGSTTVTAESASQARQQVLASRSNQKLRIISCVKLS
jgi:hypothetical protein